MDNYGLRKLDAGLDAVFFGLAVGGDDDAVAAADAANPDGAPLQLRIERDLGTGEEGTSVNVQDAIVSHRCHRLTLMFYGGHRPPL